MTEFILSSVTSRSMHKALHVQYHQLWGPRHTIAHSHDTLNDLQETVYSYHSSVTVQSHIGISHAILIYIPIGYSQI